MKTKNNIKSISIIASILIGFSMIAISCEENNFFEFPVLASYHDGIQNGDETGIDCGGNSGVACPSCTDGIQNGDETGVDCGGSCSPCPDATPRADAIRLAGTSAPYFYTFESGQEQSGLNLVPMHTNPDNSPYSQGVVALYGQDDPAGSSELVTKIERPANGPFGGFEDFKFQTFDNSIDFSVYHKFTVDVFIPNTNDFSGQLSPQVELILHDNLDGNFWQRWTVISKTIDPADYGTWVTLYIDGTNAVSDNNATPLPQNNTYTNITLRFGGSNHQEAGDFYVKDFFPVTTFVQPGTPRADALAANNTPLFFTFEAGDDTAGNVLEPRTTNPDNSAYSQGVTVAYGEADPAGSANGVGKITRPANGPFGGFEDYKFQFLDQSIDFSTLHKFKMDVYIPSADNDFSGNLSPQVELILHDNVDGNFWQRWTVISVTIDPADFDKWVTIEFDGTNALSANNGTPLPQNTTYDSYTLRFGGSNHLEQGVFYVKDFVSSN